MTGISEHCTAKKNGNEVVVRVVGSVRRAVYAVRRQVGRQRERERKDTN